MVARKKYKPKVEPKPYVPSDQERAALQRQGERYKERPPVPRLKVSEVGKLSSLEPDHPNSAIGYALLNEALGTTDIDFVHGLLWQLASTSTLDGKVEEAKLNFLLSVLKDIKPQDHTERMLVAQMGAVHLAAMRLSRQLANAETCSSRIVQRARLLNLSRRMWLKWMRSSGTVPGGNETSQCKTFP